MSSSEAILTPPDIQPAPIGGVQTLPDTPYVYRHTDGRIEDAETATAAIERCPYLGKMSLEQANIMLELSAAGNKLMADHESTDKTSTINTLSEQKQNVKPVEDRAVEIRISSSKTTEEKTSMAQPEIVTPLEQVIAQQQQIDNLISRQQAGEIDSQTKAVAVHPTTDKIVKIIQPKDKSVPNQAVDTKPKSDKAKFIPENKLPVSGDKVKDTIPGLIQDNSPNTRLVREAEPEIKVKKAIKQAVDTTKAVPLDIYRNHNIEESLTEMQLGEITPEEVFVPQITQEPATEKIEMTDEIIQTTDTMHEPEHAFLVSASNEEFKVPLRAKTIETYYELLTLAEQGADCPKDELTHGDILLDYEDPSEKVINKLNTYPTFEAYVTEQPVYSGKITLETIRIEAEDTTLEETLVKITRLISEQETNNNEGDLVPLKEMLQELQVMLPNADAEENAKPRITPELTEKLLQILREIGFENPKEELLEFVRKTDIAYMLQAFMFICKLINDDAWHEFLITPTPPTSSGDDTVKLQVAKLLFSLIAKPQYLSTNN